MPVPVSTFDIVRTSSTGPSDTQTAMASAKPGLRNIRVIDLTQGTSGPYCSILLGAFGAEVIKWGLNRGLDPDSYSTS